MTTTTKDNDTGYYNYKAHVNEQRVLHGMSGTQYISSSLISDNSQLMLIINQ